MIHFELSYKKYHRSIINLIEVSYKTSFKYHKIVMRHYA